MKKSLIKILFMCPMLSVPMVLGNYVHNNNTLQTKSNANTDVYKFRGGFEQDRYYDLTMSPASAMRMLTSYRWGTSWWRYLYKGDWKYTDEFWQDVEDYFHEHSPTSWDDTIPLENLINGKCRWVFNGIAPDGSHRYYHAFNNTTFLDYLARSVQSGLSVQLFFYVHYCGSRYNYSYGSYWSMT